MHVCGIWCKLLIYHGNEHLVGLLITQIKQTGIFVLSTKSFHLILMTVMWTSMKGFGEIMKHDDWIENNVCVWILPWEIIIVGNKKVSFG